MHKRGVKLTVHNFLKFREWFAQNQKLLLEVESDRLGHFLDAQGMVFFFKKDDEYFGAGEDSRVVFARMKHPDEETTKAWSSEATFTATNLSKMVKGEPSTYVFEKDDIKKIKVMDSEKVVEALKDEVPTKDAQITSLRIIRVGSPKDGPSFAQTDEE